MDIHFSLENIFLMFLGEPWFDFLERPNRFVPFLYMTSVSYSA